jgi:FimV-like protein
LRSISGAITIQRRSTSLSLPSPLEIPRMRAAGLLLLLAGLAARPAAAQDAAADVARGNAARAALDMPAALAAYQAAIKADSMNGEAHWKAALTLIDMGKLTPDSVASPRRDSLYDQSEVLAQRAVVLLPNSADAWFVLANAIGRAALTKSRKERVKRAVEIQQDALTAIGLDQSHDGAYHVLGRWNAEIMRLSSVERFFAKSFMGGSAFGQASWDNAQKYLRRAVALKPDWIYHRLDLAKVYIDVGNYAGAREQLEVIPTLPIADVGDPGYKAEAVLLLGQIAGKK